MFGENEQPLSLVKQSTGVVEMVKHGRVSSAQIPPCLTWPEQPNASPGRHADMLAGGCQAVGSDL